MAPPSHGMPPQHVVPPSYGMPPPPGAPQPQPIRSSELHRLRGLRDSLRATGGDGDGSADPVVLVPLMEAELAATSDAERASTLEDSIADARIAAEFGVRRAQLEFYGALSSADSAAMRSVWSSEPDVRCVPPRRKPRPPQTNPRVVDAEALRLRVVGACALLLDPRATPTAGASTPGWVRSRASTR